ncbi:helix-turn-helix transcriptional regulator [Streptomyces sp. 35G-GA-8]|uniref:helix-turn-helix domain-containing protein n=1 Tax=Streptomyces sp. 35G-GA-8 TaxID=2939434 RepID=UPI00201F0A22|nr:helix-turn-helix transcriptional regulator [Streptomyces sp. 35G-GA-8]
MGQQLSGAEEPDDSVGQKSSPRVRFLKNEAAPSAPRMVLGKELRRRREAVGLQQQEVSRRLNWSLSKTSRIECGQVKVKEQDLPALFSLYGMNDPGEQQPLRELAQIANRPMWWKPWSGIASQYLQAVLSFEDMAQCIKSYEPLYLHGLLQTPEYARALIERGRGTRSHHASLALLRKERQAKFSESPGKELICVIDEATLRRPVGNVEIMRGQVEHLIDLGEGGRFHLRLAELSRANLPVELGATTIFEFAETLLPTIAYSESFDGGLVIQDEESVDRRVRAFDLLRARSLTPGKTTQKLRDLLSSNCYR